MTSIRKKKKIPARGKFENVKSWLFSEQRQTSLLSANPRRADNKWSHLLCNKGWMEFEFWAMSFCQNWLAKKISWKLKRAGGPQTIFLRNCMLKMEGKGVWRLSDLILNLEWTFVLWCYLLIKKNGVYIIILVKVNL